MDVSEEHGQSSAGEDWNHSWEGEHSGDNRLFGCGLGSRDNKLGTCWSCSSWDIEVEVLK